MAVNNAPMFAPGQRLTQEQLAQMLALAQDSQYQGESDAGVMMSARGGAMDGKFGPEIRWDPTMVQQGTGESMQMVADPNGAGRWLISQPRNVSNWGNNDTTDVWDAQGNPIGPSSGQTGLRGLATVLASAAGGAYANGGFGTGSLSGGATAGAAGATGMTTAEQAAFLEANAGAFAPGGEIAAGYGTTWGVGADGIIGQGATMMADGELLDPWRLEDPANYGNEGNNYKTPQGADGQPTSPTNTPNNTPNNAPPANNGPGAKTPYTVSDAARLASAGLRVAGSLDNGGGGGMDGDTDPRLLDAQLRSMDTQEQLMQRMIGNADMILPFQRDALEFGLRTAKEAYGDYRDDRTYALGRRDQLTGLQDRMITDARDFNTEARREELAGQAIADVNRSFSGALGQTARTMSRRGMDPNDGRWASAVRTLVADKTLAQASAANNARADARKEGYALTDRAAGTLAQSPGLALQTTGAGADAGAKPLGMTNTTATSIQAGLQPAAQLAGQWGSNATQMYSAQNRNNGSGGSDWGGYGALLAGAAKAWDAFGG